MAGASKRKRSWTKRDAMKRRKTDPSKYLLPTTYIKNAVPEAKFVIRQWITNWPFNTTTTGGFYREITPNLQQILNVPEYQVLFDMYIVDRIAVHVVPRFGDVVLPATGNTNQTIQTNNNQLYATIGKQTGRIVTPTGTYGSTSYNTFLANVNNPKMFKLDKPFTYSFKPHVTEEIASGRLSIKTQPWTSLDAPDLPLIGCLMYISDTNFSAINTSFMGVDLHYTFYFRCKGSR